MIGQTNAGQKLAMVIDDMAVIRQLLMAILKDLDFECIGASNGRVALDLLSKRKVDLVLCDWNMPGMNGSELVKAIRATHPSLPIIMVTAESDPARVAELRDLGISGYVIKPFKPPVLVKLVQKIFQTH